MTKNPNDPNRDHPETTDSRPGDNPQAAKEEAENLRPNPETGGDAENTLESEFEATDERDLDTEPRRAPPLVEATDAISTTALNEGAETARIPIEEAITLVAERGVTEVSATLAAPPAAEAAAAPAEEAVPSPAAPPPAPDTTGEPVPQGANPATEGAASPRCLRPVPPHP